MRRRGRAAALAAVLLAFLAGCETPEGAAPLEGAAEAPSAADTTTARAAEYPAPPAAPDQPKDAPPAEIEAGTGNVQRSAIEAGTGRIARVAPPQAPPGGTAPAEREAAVMADGAALEPLAPRRQRPRRDAEADRTLAETHRRLGLALEAAGDIEAATSEFEAALAVRWPTATRDTPWTDLARICRRGEPAAAVARACRRVLTLTRFSPAELAEFLANLGDAHVRLGRPGTARENYRTALEIDSDNFRALLGLARLRLAEGNAAAALNDLRLAIASGPRPAEARLVRARAWLALGEPARAVADYDAVLADMAAKPFHASAWRGRAEAHCAMGRAEAAAVDWHVWASSVPDGAARLQEMLRARGELVGPPEEGIGPATLAALKAWTREGCP